MHDRRREIEERLGRFMEERLRPALLRPLVPLDLEVWHVPTAEDGGPGEPVPFEVARAAAYAPARVGDRWGPAWGTSWFRVRGRVPDDARHPEVAFDLGWSTRRPGMQAEALALRADGSVVKALNPLNSWLPVAPGEEVDLFVEAAANPTIGPGYRPTTEGDRATSTRTPLYSVSRAEVCERDPDLAELNADIDVLDGLWRTLADQDPRRWDVFEAFDRMLDLLDPDDVAAHAAEARAVLAPLLRRPAHPSAHRVSAVGHAHIDSAWLWPVRETVRKVGRTVANVVHLLDTTEDLVHCMSSAQQWAWLQERQPELFERVMAHVRDGRFVPVGGMWVESDTNMVGGEAMVRQFVHGKSWMREHLGVDCEEVWLPDSFGYTAALPQIVRLAGFRWFLTQKISWNTVNRFPHHTFWWEGIDGTRVFTHFPPADTYNGSLSANELDRASRQFREKGVATRSLIPFGFGDGGGGPTREMLARARRTADLEGSPRVAVEPPRAFFEKAEEEYAERAPVWVGELYLEIHRGTYTSQARTKQGNRRSEHLLREAELWSATADVRGLLDYPYVELRRAWDTVLLNQFHDILPGSSISWVHREAERQYADVAGALEGIVERATESLAGTASADEDAEPVELNAAPVPSATGVPPLAGAPRAPRADPTRTGRDGDDVVLDNGMLRARVDPRGAVRSLVHLPTGRETVPPGGAVNLLQLHRDTPNKWDAWDIDRFYRHVGTDVNGVASTGSTIEAVEDDDTVRVHHAFGDSTAVQRISLRPGSTQLDIETEVDWHEREKLLKLAVDADVHTDHARYETQFGHVTRPTHENTTWDAARFEVCAHRWVQVADAGFGVAVANDATYGHDVTRHPREGGGTFSRVRLTLLRAPRYPDPETDQGRHLFRCAVVPAAGVRQAVAAGYRLNLPARLVAGSPVEPLVRVDGSVEGSVYVEAVKLAEDRSGDVVVRLYEGAGARSAATVRPTFAVSSVAEVDLLEQALPADALQGVDEDGTARVVLRPFQIVTLRLGRG
jgi:alpha-mannosidase